MCVLHQYVVKLVQKKHHGIVLQQVHLQQTS